MPRKRKSAAANVPRKSKDDWSAMTVVRLKKELELRGLDTTGKKADLVRKLEESNDDDGNSSHARLSTTKKQKKEEQTPKSAMQTAIEQLKKSDTSSEAKNYKLDIYLQNSPNLYVGVHEDYSFMLNQTNIGNNNNKFYVGQLVKKPDGRYAVFTKWGRVGEQGATALFDPLDLDEAIKTFGKKFTDKTGNKWEDRANFKAKTGKYTMIETQADDEETDAAVALDGELKVIGNSAAKSALDKVTQDLVSLIFDHDMFNDAMKRLNLDTKKMPLGKLSKTQIARGFEVLEKMETVLKNGSKAGLTNLSNEFYTLIPHDFGRTRPPVIEDLSVVQEKFDMLITLGDIEIAQEMEKGQKASEALHPCDVKYGLLKCNLSPLDPCSHEFKVIVKYIENTSADGNAPRLRNVWTVDRTGEQTRFQQHDKIQHRKLLWHGTNVAVVAAILKTGLRVMPHSGGRVGCGIYFASENAKSAGYTSPAKKVGLMFLNEVALGKEHEIMHDDSSLTKAPPGFDSVVARGQREPDAVVDTLISLDGKEVIVPQGPPVEQNKFRASNFYQSEYLVYKESQVRIRYLLAFDWQY